ncbi:MAG: hypothetical protein V3Q69_06190 [Burkholderia sp.]
MQHLRQSVNCINGKKCTNNYHPKRRCCINRAKAVDVYTQRSPASPPIKSDSRVTA